MDVTATSPCPSPKAIDRDLMDLDQLDGLLMPSATSWAHLKGFGPPSTTSGADHIQSEKNSSDLDKQIEALFRREALTEEQSRQICELAKLTLAKEENVVSLSCPITIVGDIREFMKIVLLTVVPLISIPNNHSANGP